MNQNNKWINNESILVFFLFVFVILSFPSHCSSVSLPVCVPPHLPPAGRGGFLWPGLNVPIIKSGTIQSFSKRGETEQQELRAELERQRDEWDRKRKMKIKRERGWSGNCWGGISLGHPDPGPNGGVCLSARKTWIVCQLYTCMCVCAPATGISFQ